MIKLKNTLFWFARRNNEKNIIILLLISLGFLFGSKVFAKETAAGYSVSPHFSEHQESEVDNFFDIRWAPGMKDIFTINITNNTDKEQSYLIQVNKARTNKNGMIDYSDSKSAETKGHYKLTEMIKIEKEVTVPANSSKNIPGSIHFPEQSFNGILMAGIHVSEKK